MMRRHRLCYLPHRRAVLMTAALMTELIKNAPLKAALLLIAGLVLNGCRKPDSIHDYITQVQVDMRAQSQSAHSQATNLQAMADETSLALVAPSYQALAERTPFFWQANSSFPKAPLASSDPTAAIVKSLNQRILNKAVPDQPYTDCEPTPRPRLILQAVFKEHQRGGPASALIQVADSEVYVVKQGQRLIANPLHSLSGPNSQDRAKKSTTLELSKSESMELGIVTAINAQSVTIAHSTTDCPAQVITLKLYD